MPFAPSLARCKAAPKPLQIKIPRYTVVISTSRAGLTLRAIGLLHNVDEAEVALSAHHITASNVI